MGSATILVVSGTAYAIAATTSPAGTRGGSAMGLAFGTVGFGFMIFAGLLGARKRVPTWRLGRAQRWMRGHLWLGLLSLPLILFHGGFHFGGTLTRVLMWLLVITVGSGVFGAALQHYLPRILTADVPLETIYDEIGNVRRALREEADRAMEASCGAMGLTTAEDESAQRAGGFTALRPFGAATVMLRTSAAVSAGASAAGVATAAEIPALRMEDRETLKRFYLTEVRGFLETPKLSGQRLGNAERAKAAFAGLRTVLPATAYGVLKDLEEICDEARQLLLQEKMHRWLHGWLLVHIPLSVALLLLGAIHAVAALRY